MGTLQDQLKRLEAKHGKESTAEQQRLRVYYGWRKLSKSVKRESLAVVFLDDDPGPRIDKDGYDGVTKYIHVAYSRWQTKQEALDGKLSNRMYTMYEIFMDDKYVQGSLERALQANYDSDKNNVSKKEREIIRDKLRVAYLASNPDYREPHGVQLFIDFQYSS